MFPGLLDSPYTRYYYNMAVNSDQPRLSQRVKPTVCSDEARPDCRILTSAEFGVTIMKRKKLDKGTEARRLARKAAARPGATKVVQDRRKKPEKHKGKWLEEQGT